MLLASVDYYRQHSTLLTAVLVVVRNATVTLDEKELEVSFVSTNYFAELGVKPERGRLLGSSDEETGALISAV